MYCLAKMIYYKLIKVTVNVLSLAPVFLNIAIKYNSILYYIVNNEGLVFTSKFKSSLYYIFNI